MHMRFMFVRSSSANNNRLVDADDVLSLIDFRPTQTDQSG